MKRLSSKVDPVAAVEAFLDTNGSILMSSQDIATRTGLSVGETNRALFELHRKGKVRTDSHAMMWTNIFPTLSSGLNREMVLAAG